MVSSSVWDGLEEVLNLVKEHSEKYKPSKPATTKLERMSGWAALTGGIVFVAGEVVRQAGDMRIPSVQWGYLSLSILGLVLFFGGVVVNVVEFVRTTRRPFVEHIDRILEAIARESELIAALERFESVTLELACKRLRLESTKVASRLGVIGGGEGLRTSLVGIAILGTTLISQYESVIHGWTIKSFAYFGVALLLGLSIGGLLVRYGASQADYYSEIIELALQRKAHMPRTARNPFSRRVWTKRRDNG